MSRRRSSRPVAALSPAPPPADRPSLHGGVSLLALLGLALPAAANAACLPTSRLVSTSIPGPVLADGGSIDITATGAVSGSINGIDLTACGATTIGNAGTVDGSSYAGIRLFNQGIGTLTNAGAITGYIGVYSKGTIGSFANTGTIDGGQYGLNNAGTIGSLTNAGTIRGGERGVQNTGSIGALSNTGRLNGIGGYDLYNTGTIAMLANGGSIASVADFGRTPSVTNAAGGFIGHWYNGGAQTGSMTNSGTMGLKVQGGTITALSNSGIINADLINRGGTIVSLTNTGTISATNEPGIENRNGGTIASLNNAGTISGLVGIFNSYGAIGSLSNTGKITGIQNVGGTVASLSNTGTITTVLNENGTIASLSNTGTITGFDTGISNNYGTIASLTNAGTIAGNLFGVQNLFNSTIASLSNTGMITGGLYGIQNIYGTIASLTNAGTIAAPTAIWSDHGGLGPITNTGLISGHVLIGYQDLTLYGGTGTSFGTIAGGVVNILDGNLLFAGGNTHLKSDISVNGGAGTVTNQGVLRVSTPQSIAGHFAQPAGATLNMQLAGTGAGQFGRLSVSGAIQLAGILSLDLVGGFTLALGDSFRLLDFDSLAGDFDSLVLNGIACTSGGTDDWYCSNLSGGLYLSEVIGTNSLDLVVRSSDTSEVPEPGSFALLASALAALAFLWRRRPAPGDSESGMHSARMG